MRPRFVGRLGLADAVTTGNAVLGFGAIAAVAADAGLVGPAARLLLLAAIADGLDGLLARRRGSTPAGEYLDSLSDVVSFGVAPALLVFLSVTRHRAIDPGAPAWSALAVGLPALFVAMAIVRLGFYTAYDADDAHTEGVQTTLAATVLVAAILVGAGPLVALAATGVLAYLMIARVEYPDLEVLDALLLGVVQAATIVAPGYLDGVFPATLLVWALAYLLLAPRYYPR